MSLETNRTTPPRATHRLDDASGADRRSVYGNVEFGVWTIVVLLVVAFAMWTYNAILSLP